MLKVYFTQNYEAEYLKVQFLTVNLLGLFTKAKTAKQFIYHAFTDCVASDVA